MNNQNFLNNQTNKGYGDAALVLGMLSVVTLPFVFPLMILMPLLALVISIVAIALGAISLKAQSKTSAIIGMTLGFLTGAYWLWLIFVS